MLTLLPDISAFLLLLRCVQNWITDTSGSQRKSQTAHSDADLIIKQFKGTFEVGINADLTTVCASMVPVLNCCHTSHSTVINWNSACFCSFCGWHCFLLLTFVMQWLLIFFLFLRSKRKRKSHNFLRGVSDFLQLRGITTITYSEN